MDDLEECHRSQDTRDATITQCDASTPIGHIDLYQMISDDTPRYRECYCTIYLDWDYMMKLDSQVIGCYT